MLIEALAAARDLGRLHEIARVLARHGLGDFVRRVGIATALERAGRKLHLVDEDSALTRPPEERLRLALEELGPTFVKIGQILAGRGDLLPPHWTRELARLQEHAAPVPFEELQPRLAEDLGDDLASAFRELDREPLAAGSIAQVHAARLADGTRVVLKLRRPGITERVEADLRWLARLAELAESEVDELRRYRPVALARQLSRSLRNELDFRHEAKNAERIAENLGDLAEVVIPRVHGRWTRDRLLVQDRLEGPSLGQWLDEGAPGHDPKQLARAGADVVLHMVFTDGFFHADPHPGNVLLLPDGRLGLIDFGMVGRISRGRREELLLLLAGVVRGREDDVTDVLIEWSKDGASDPDALRDDCAAFVDRYRDASLGRLDVGELLRDLTSLLRANDLFLPSDVALLIKTFVTLEGLGRRLDPAFVLAERIEPFARRTLSRAHSPLARLARGGRELRELLSGLPGDARAVARRLRSGKLKLEVNVGGAEELGKAVRRSADRVSLALLTSAFILGTALTLNLSGTGGTFALLAFLSSLAFGAWLLWQILRGR